MELHIITEKLLFVVVSVLFIRKLGSTILNEMSCRERKFVSMLVCLVMTFIVCDSVPVYTDLLMNPDDISTLVKAAVCITIF